MNKGVLIFAHNSPKVDYALMAMVSGSLAKKNLNVPVSLVTDRNTLKWIEESGKKELADIIFEHIIVSDDVEQYNERRLFDGENSEVVPFKNFNRNLAFELSPYDRTLLIDSDYLVLSNRLNEYWDVEEDFLIAQSCADIHDDSRLGYLDKHISETGIHMFWATTIMFSKSSKSKIIFDYVDSIKENYLRVGIVEHTWTS